MNEFPPNEHQPNQHQPNESQPGEPGEPGVDGAAGRPKPSDSRSRLIYDGTTGSTRGLRDTSRRRRDAEVKLQQHLMAAKDHVPHHHDDIQQDRDGSEEGQRADAPRT